MSRIRIGAVLTQRELAEMRELLSRMRASGDYPDTQRKRICDRCGAALRRGERRAQPTNRTQNK